MSSHRVARVSDVLQRELSSILAFEMKDPRVSLATVSGVRLSGDLQHAVVAVSVLGTEDEREACMAALERATGFIRSRLAPRIDLRSVPELRFVLDRGAEHSQHIEEILESLPELAREADEETEDRDEP